MSTSALLISIQQNLYRFGGPLLLLVGTISCILNLMVFTKNTLRKNPCTICLIGVNITNFLFLYLDFLFTMLATGYNINLTSNNIIFCRFNTYVAFVLVCLESSYLILASIDRTLVTSRNAGTRRLSTRRFIHISMISLALFWALFNIHALIFIQIVQFGPNKFVCYYQPGRYTTFITFYSLVISGVLPPALMALFGCWTVKNVSQIHRVRQDSRATNTSVVVAGRPRTLQSKDQQLIRMLFIEILTYVICKFPVTIFYIYQQITQYTEKSVEEVLIEQSILQLIYFLYFVESAIGCYSNILVSKTFRTEIKRSLSNAYQSFLRQLH
jgi:hypothetical protein